VAQPSQRSRPTVTGRRASQPSAPARVVLLLGLARCGKPAGCSSHKGTRFWFLQCCKYWQWMATYGSGFACPGMLKMRSRVGRASDAWGVARQRSGGESSRWKLPLRARLAKANSGRNARLLTRNDDRAATSGRGASLASGSAHGLGCASTLRLYLC
jgi:hypothetical protein